MIKFYYSRTSQLHSCSSVLPTFCPEHRVVVTRCAKNRVIWRVRGVDLMYPVEGVEERWGYMLARCEYPVPTIRTDDDPRKVHARISTHRSNSTAHAGEVQQDGRSLLVDLAIKLPKGSERGKMNRCATCKRGMSMGIGARRSREEVAPSNKAVPLGRESPVD